MEPAAARGRARRVAPLVGAAAGLFGSLVGVGGGVLIVPAIVGACPGISQRCAQGLGFGVPAANTARLVTASEAGAMTSFFRRSIGQTMQHVMRGDPGPGAAAQTGGDGDTHTVHNTFQVNRTMCTKMKNCH